MLTMQKADGKAGIYVETAGTPIDRLLEKEWLLTNGRGGFASSTVAGCNTRRYHGLLTAALDPPTNRILALSNCLETIYMGPGRFELGTVEFPDRIWPDGYLRLKGFRKDAGVHFHYELGVLRLTKSVYLLSEQETVAIAYEFVEVPQSIEFVLRPLVAMRDFHSLQKASSPIMAVTVPDGLLIHEAIPGASQLLLSFPGASFEEEPQWWNNFVYRADKERGQDYCEDLFSPGQYKCRIDSPGALVLWANLSKDYKPEELAPADIEDVIRKLSKRHNSIIAPAKDDKNLQTLFSAADQFIVRRGTQDGGHTLLRRSSYEGQATIMAGYPWFADWGRDAFISLPGLLLATRRFAEAKSVLVTFAKAADRGMIPNCFDDYDNTAHFNSVDASLWFINAAFEYLKISGDEETFEDILLPAIILIIDAYRHGTRFGIHADNDGLITAGDSSTQLTWMDAKCGGVVFTPRFGKPVEVNALWYNALMLLEQYYEDKDDSQVKLKDETDKVRESFCGLFWNERWGWLNDCILPDGTADATLRPNQIFAVSLPFSPLGPAQRKAVVGIVEKKLLTPFGLRTLSPDDKRYQGRYTGAQFERDRAYHQGTVWPYLIGPFVEAFLKVHGFSIKSKKQARTFIEAMLSHLNDDGCLGQLCEVFDGDAPQKPKGCFAQAWSVAELIRVYMMVR